MASHLNSPNIEKKNEKVSQIKAPEKKKLGCAHSSNVLYCSICNRKISSQRMKVLIPSRKL